jgi:integrase
MGRRSKGPWYRTSHKAWYAKIGGKQVRLDTDPSRAAERFRALTATREVRTVADLVAAYLADRGPRVKPLTLELYRSHAESFVRVAGEMAASEVRPLHVTAWIAGRGIGANTATVARRIVKAVWRWGLAEGHLEGDVLGRLRVGTVGRRREVRTEDVGAWIAAIDRPALRDWAEIALETGMRPGEQAGVTAADVVAVQSYVKTTGKTGARLVFLSRTAADRLAALAALRPTGPLLLTPGWRRPWNLNSLDYAFRRHSARCGIELVPYDLRHEFASRLHTRGVDVLTISRLLGHASIAMASKHYVRTDAAVLLAALDRVG